MSSSDYLALVELHLRNMLATVEGMDDLEALTTEGKMEEEEELGRLLFLHKADTGFKCSTPPFQICKRDDRLRPQEVKIKLYLRIKKTFIGMNQSAKNITEGLHQICIQR